jgi:hypothetical protein
MLLCRGPARKGKLPGPHASGRRLLSRVPQPRTSMFTSTIMPGDSCTGGSSMVTRTGMRWVILVKLPLGFGVGSSAKFAVVLWPIRSTVPLNVWSG